MYITIGDNNIRVDSDNIKQTTFSKRYKDIKNYDEISVSFSKPIEVIRNEKINKVFQSLFNINTINGYDITKTIPGSIYEDSGDLIFRGNVKIVDFNDERYSIVLFGDYFNLFNEIGESLITGNLDASLDIKFDPSDGWMKYERTAVRNSWAQNIPQDASYIFPLIQYDELLWAGVNPTMHPIYNNFSSFTNDYPILPALSVKVLFDKIFKDAGFTYEMSTEFSDMLSKMYIPFNGDINNIAEDYTYAKYYGRYAISAYAAETVYCPIGKEEEYTYKGVNYPSLQLYMWTFDASNTYGTTVNDGHDYIFNYPSYYEIFNQYIVNITLPHRGTYDIKVALEMVNRGGAGNDATVQLTTWNIIDGHNTIDGSSYEIVSTTQTEDTFRVTVSEKSILMVNLTHDDDIEWNSQAKFGTNTYIEIKEIKSLLNGYISLNNILPINLQKAELVNAVLKIFNADVIVNEINPKKLYIYNREDFMSGYKTYDWTNKFIKGTWSSVINNGPKNYKFKFRTDNDIYNTDFNSRSSTGMYSYQNEVDSEFAKGESVIEIPTSATATVLLDGPDNYKGSDYYVYGGIEIPIMSNGTYTFVNKWKPRIMFQKEVSLGSYTSTAYYGSDAPGNFIKISGIHTLSNSLTGTCDASDFFLGFDSRYTYMAGNPKVTDNTILSKYYQRELDEYDRYTYLLEGKFMLTPRDYSQIKFNDKIYINSKNGRSWYRLNLIDNFTVNDISDVELITIEK